MPLIILGVIVVVAVLLIFYYINSGVRRMQSKDYRYFSDSTDETDDESGGKVIALFDVEDVQDEDEDSTQPEEEE